MIKFSSVVHQADDREVRPLEQNQVDSACAVNKARMGDYPRLEEDVTPEQLAALRALFSSGAPPYVDLAVWEPYGRRIQRKLRFSGQVLVAQGILHTVQLYGPPTVCECRLAGLSFKKKKQKNGAIMLQELSPSSLNLCEKVVTNNAARYGPETWALIYNSAGAHVSCAPRRRCSSSWR